MMLPKKTLKNLHPHPKIKIHVFLSVNFSYEDIFHVQDPIYGWFHHYYGLFIFNYGLVYGFLQKTVKHWFFNEFHNITFSGDRTVTVTVTVNRNRKTVKP